MDDTNIKNIIGRLESVYDDLTAAIRSARNTEKAAKEKAKKQKATEENVKKQKEE